MNLKSRREHLPVLGQTGQLPFEGRHASVFKCLSDTNERLVVPKNVSVFSAGREVEIRLLNGCRAQNTLQRRNVSSLMLTNCLENREHARRNKTGLIQSDTVKRTFEVLQRQCIVQNIDDLTGPTL